MSKIDTRLRSELGSFYALIVINIVVSAAAMGLSISYAVPGILVFVGVLESIDPPYSLPLAALAIAIFSVAINWLISSVEIFDEAQDIKDELEGKGGAEGLGTTSVIVKTMALYRARKATIARMVCVSRATGILFLGMGVYNSFTSIASGAPDQPGLAAAAIALNFAMGAAVLCVPHLFGNFAKTWESRLAQSERAEVVLRQVLEGGA